MKTFKPKSLPLKNLPWDSFRPYLKKAHKVIDQFNAGTKDIDKRIQQEVSSSTHSRKKKYTVPCERALRFALTTKNPFTDVAICKIHKLLTSTHESGYRKRQNWIGPIGCPIEEGRYFPPEAKLVPMYMKRLRKYLSYAEKDPLVHLAIYFAQFLAIHPFMDGNGRVARILIPAFLYRKKVTKEPAFFMSKFFARHHDEYYERLFALSEKNDWKGWIIFFLRGVIESGS